MFADIFGDMSSQELANTALYNSIITLLEQVKLVHGGQGLLETLKRHQRLRNFLTKYQKTLIYDLESKITDNLNCIIESSDS